MRSVFSFSAICSLQLNLSFSKTLKRFRNWQFHSNATKTQATFWSGVHFKPTTILELLNALSHVAILVLSFITQREYWDPRDPLRSLITLRVPAPMLFTAKLALIAINYTLVKQEDDQVTDSENTFATQKEMTRTHPNQSRFSPIYSQCPTTSRYVVRVEFFCLLIIQFVRYAPKQLFTLMSLKMLDTDPQHGE